MAKRTTKKASQGLRLIPLIRTSTDDQKNGLAAQYSAVESYAKQHGHTLYSIVAPQHTSGCKDNWVNRTDIRQAVQACKDGYADGIIASRLDRICRSTRHLHELADELSAIGCHLIVTEQQIDTSTPTGRLLFSLLSAISEFERDLISQRTKEGLAIVSTRNATYGPPLGKKNIGKPSTLTRNQELIAFVLESYEHTGSYRATAAHAANRFAIKFDANQVKRMVAKEAV